jgi:RHS repeat-associated protein
LSLPRVSSRRKQSWQTTSVVRGGNSGAPARRFRKTCLHRFRSYIPGNHPLPAQARTCFEGPFGEVIRATGPMAKANPFRFSTKYQDDESDLLYYDYRYYNPSTGRWNSRDSIGEQGGLNPYGFVHNDSIRLVDSDGRQSYPGGAFPIPSPPGGPNIPDPRPPGWPSPLPYPPPPPPDDPPIYVPPAPIMPISAPWQVCCRPVKGDWLERRFRHCDLRQGPPDPGTKSTCYPVTRDPKCCNKNITSDLDMSKCLRAHPTTAGGGICGGLWNNCQTSTANALRACCAKSTWIPSWYGEPPIIIAWR